MFNKFKSKILNQLQHGVSREVIAKSLTLGVLVGCFPLLGFTTPLGLLLGAMLKLNHVVLQAANYIMYPVQILLIPVYISLVSYFYDVGDVPINPVAIANLFAKDPWDFLKLYGLVGVYAVIIWSIASTALYWLLHRLLYRWVTKQ